MKSKFLVLSVAICMVCGANAQTGGTTNPTSGKQGGMPNQPGQPGMQPGKQGGMPNQPGQPGMQPGMQGGMPNQPGQPGMQAKGNAWPSSKCESELPKLRKAGENCVDMKKENKRKECFSKIESKFPREFWDSCKSSIEPLRAELESKAKQKYPEQASGVPGQEKGPQGGMPNQGGQGQPGMMPNQAGQGQPGMQPGMMPNQAGQGQPGGQHSKSSGKKVDCSSLASKVKTEAGKCIKMKEQASRKSCFDKVGQEVEKKNAGGACEEVLNPLKTEFQTLEAQKYPGEPASIQ